MPTDSLRITAPAYQQLRRIASWKLGQESPTITLDPTELVHEALIRLYEQRSGEGRHAAHRLALSVMMMRRVLLNHVRSRRAVKRGGDRKRRVYCESTLHSDGDRDAGLVLLRDALSRLGDLDPRQLAVVELRVIGSLSVRETALRLGISDRTVETLTRHARLWLARELRDG
ncbi:MAG: ECF-type sigma factor [Planctomycetota bacterium]